jgi:hypothetical protein
MLRRSPRSPKERRFLRPDGGPASRWTDTPTTVKEEASKVTPIPKFIRLARSVNFATPGLLLDGNGTNFTGGVVRVVHPKPVIPNVENSVSSNDGEDSEHAATQPEMVVDDTIGDEIVEDEMVMSTDDEEAIPLLESTLNRALFHDSRQGRGGESGQLGYHGQNYVESGACKLHVVRRMKSRQTIEFDPLPLTQAFKTVPSNDDEDDDKTVEMDEDDKQRQADFQHWEMRK